MAERKESGKFARGMGEKPCLGREVRSNWRMEGWLGLFFGFH